MIQLNDMNPLNIISDKQHGFRKGHSCETKLITTVNDLLPSADVGNRVDISILAIQGIRHGFSSQIDIQSRSLWYKRKHP